MSGKVHAGHAHTRTRVRLPSGQVARVFFVDGRTGRAKVVLPSGAVLTVPRADLELVDVEDDPA